MKSLKFCHSKLFNIKTLVFNFKRSSIAGILMMIVFFLSLTGTQKIQAQTYGPPLFTEDFGTVPTGQDANTYRGEITGRGLSLIHISEPTRLGMISYAVFCLK